MSIRLNPISVKELTRVEQESILEHAIDLHLVGSDDADSVGFDIVEKRSTTVLHLLRAVDDEKSVGVVYVLPVRGAKDLVEMTVLIFSEFRGKHYTGSLVDAVETFLRENHTATLSLGAAVHDHNPMRNELTDFLLRHGYSYSPAHRLFVKPLA